MSPSRKFLLRPMVPEDVPQVIELDKITQGAVHWTESDYTRAATPGSGIKGWVAEVDSAIIAFLVARTTFGEMEILNLVVSGIYRRRGIGSRLLADRMDTVQHGSTKVAFLEVRESNEAARAFYAKIGFRETGRRPQYYNFPTEDAIVLRRDIIHPK
jgi:[ribosomal protein S18]-alanine N-acetyltransferase